MLKELTENTMVALEMAFALSLLFTGLTALAYKVLGPRFVSDDVLAGTALIMATTFYAIVAFAIVSGSA